MVGLGLIYGAPGTGKTRFARRFVIENNYLYLRLEATTTPKVFATQLLEALQNHYNITQRIKGSANELYNQAVEIIHDIPEDVVIFIDEIDYAFKKQSLLGMIRDIVDETVAVVILVGMQNAKNLLLKANAHYFDRCGYFVHFQNLPKKDTALVCERISEVKLNKPELDNIYKRSGGNLRKIIKLVYAYEATKEA
jgi:replication-associated recombination protein RarA